MKWIINLLFAVAAVTLYAQNGRYVELDGKDSNLCIGMDTINNNWSIEMWVRANDNTWKEQEVLIGGGEYSDINSVDKLPIVIKEGKLHNTHSGISSVSAIGDEWQHIAVTCGSNGTIIYINGKKEASAETTSAIIAGTIGADEGEESVFGGDIDEVRIWRCQLSQEQITKWMGRSLDATHPKINMLKGYYPFDEPTNDTYINWVGSGVTPFHVRNSRIKYYDSSYITPTVESDNKKLVVAAGKKRIFNGVEIASEWDSQVGAKDQQIIKLRVALSAANGKATLSNILLDLSKSTNLSDIERVNLYYTGSSSKTDIREKITTLTPSQFMDIDLSYPLESGINYFLVTFDISNNAKLSSTLSATIDSYSVNGKAYKATKSNSFYPKQVIPNSSDRSIIKLLQWNIWHSGIHCGADGRAHIIDLIRETDADIVTLQEGYGAQERISKELKYNLQTQSSKDNLALLSRYPIKKIETKNGFKSNPAIITLPSGKQIYVNDCWLRYAYRPEYTCCYGSQGLDTNIWVEEDRELATEDIKQILNDDMNGYLNECSAQIIGGDFNSCSHLDWSERTKHLHYGYGKVDFPTSIFMSENGFTDSYRAVNPDEVTHQGSTYAVVFGQLQNSRIDFLYHRGEIKPLYAKIIRTSEEIDFVWASDHAAVFVIYDISKQK